MNSLVIGGAGFIGSHLCDALYAAGDKVICMDNLSRGSRDNIAHLEGQERFRLYVADAGNKDYLEEIFKKERPEYIFHLAANSDIRKSAENPEVELRNTYLTTYQILEAMRKNSVNKLFFSSTSAVYGEKGDEQMDESTPGLTPVSYYGAAKLGSEALISAYSQMNGMRSVVFRFPNVVGPRLTHGVIYDFIRKLKNNPEQLLILGDGKQEKPYLDVSDLIRALMRVKDGADVGINLYTLCTEGTTTVNTIADCVCREMNLQNVRYIYTGGSVGWKGDIPRFRFSSDKIRRHTGWNAKYTSDEAVVRAVRDNI